MVVLLAEDDEDIARVLTRVFTRAGMAVVHAGDGAAALAMAVVRRPEVIVTDIGMPVMDGWELVRALRRHTGLKDVPVVVLSGQLTPGDPQAAEAGVCAVLLKPCPNHRLLAVVQQLAITGPHTHDAAGSTARCAAASLVPV